MVWKASQDPEQGFARHANLFPATRNHLIETRILIEFPVTVSGPVSGLAKKTQSRKVREGSGKVSAKLIRL